MKKLLLLSVWLMASVVLCAQEAGKGILFLDNKPWEEVVKQAQKQRKPIFVDCYTSWCGPCKKLAAEVFTQKEVGKYINKNFVSVKYDVEKDAGLAFARKYRDQITAFPTLLLIRPDGSVMQRIVGAYPTKEILEAIQNGLAGKTWQTLEKEYLNGKKDYDFVMSYLDMLLKSGEEKKYAEVKRSYVKQFPVDSLLNPQIWELAAEYVRHPDTEEYQFVLQNLSAFGQRGFDRHDLEWTLSINAYYQINDIIKTGFKTQNQDTIAELKKQLERLKVTLNHPVKRFPEELAYVRIEESYLNGDIEELAYRLIYLGEHHLVESLDWTKRWMEYVVDNTTDNQLLQRCMKYLYQAQIANEVGNDWIVTNCYGVLAKGHEKLGDLNKAAEYAQKAQLIEKQNKERLNSIPSL
ncbi:MULTISPECIES: thioredoxin family protein [Butyricimonas]|uniref:thioredoxin family protein n=1 Tax=Butyricimonas TaxID=574697 RepID=UPI0007FB5457|nr:MULTISPECIES: thioredoxin family protein [Butyricimonas]